MPPQRHLRYEAAGDKILGSLSGYLASVIIALADYFAKMEFPLYTLGVFYSHLHEHGRQSI